MEENEAKGAVPIFPLMYVIAGASVACIGLAGAASLGEVGRIAMTSLLPIVGSFGIVIGIGTVISGATFAARMISAAG